MITATFQLFLWGYGTAATKLKPRPQKIQKQAPCLRQKHKNICTFWDDTVSKLDLLVTEISSLCKAHFWLTIFDVMKLHFR